MGRVLMCSVSPEPYRAARSYKSDFVIPACPHGQIFSSLWIEDAVDTKMVYSGLQKADREAIPIDIPAQLIAHDLMQNEGIKGLEREGVWICTEGHPTDLQVHTARQRREAELLSRVNDGDKLYARLGQRGLDQIPDYCKRAVVELGETREWVLGKAKAKIQCEGCGTRVEPLGDGSAPAYCPNCHTVINEARATELEAKANRVKQAKEPEAEHEPKPKKEKTPSHQS